MPASFVRFILLTNGKTLPPLICSSLSIIYISRQLVSPKHKNYKKKTKQKFSDVYLYIYYIFSSIRPSFSAINLVSRVMVTPEQLGTLQEHRLRPRIITWIRCDNSHSPQSCGVSSSSANFCSSTPEDFRDMKGTSTVENTVDYNLSR